MNNASSQNRSELKEIARRAMVERGLEPEFPPDAQAQLQQIHGPAPAAGPDRKDLRDLLWCSIDNDDSRDLDQLSVAESVPGGGLRILVAVADVDALVRKGDAIDAHARRNTTSVYTAAQIFPMLPEQLSTDWTSLNQDQDREALVVEFEVGQDGSVGKSSILLASVRNKAKLAYDAVSAWLDGKSEPPAAIARVPGLADQLRSQKSAAEKLREQRFEHGALDLETIQPKAVFDGDTVVGLRQEPHNRARRLIEDFMIAANGVTARFLSDRGFSALRRVVRSPERWQRIVEVARESGEKLPPEPDSKALSDFLARRRKADPDRFPDLSLVIVKLMGAGEYVVERPNRPSIGHFGLAVRDYAH
ncbi:MAG TPA: ribonuclease catalytic domain-containing protein, partial [Thermoanaerobaculia bacterium]|nr:ribonuclease catalytic domain-containing protein [Thermoanaerobaculia bacterium]